jgi:hypothetical protein
MDSSTFATLTSSGTGFLGHLPTGRTALTTGDGGRFARLRDGYAMGRADEERKAMRILILQRTLLRRRSAGPPTPITATARDYRHDPPIPQIMLALMAAGLIALVIVWYAV